jgi:hypothetical protein
MLPLSDGSYNNTRKCFGSFLGEIIPNTVTDDPMRCGGAISITLNARTGRLIFAYRPRLGHSSGGSVLSSRLDFRKDTRLHVENKAPYRDVLCNPRM